MNEFWKEVGINSEAALRVFDKAVKNNLLFDWLWSKEDKENTQLLEYNLSANSFLRNLQTLQYSSNIRSLQLLKRRDLQIACR